MVFTETAPRTSPREPPNVTSMSYTQSSHESSNVIAFRQPEGHAGRMRQRALIQRLSLSEKSRAKAGLLLRNTHEWMCLQEVLRALFAARQQAARRIAKLTPEQRHVMKLILSGKTDASIAWELGIGQSMAERQRAAIMRETGTACVSALARLVLSALVYADGECHDRQLSRLALEAAWNSRHVYDPV